jgi:hypothetical protein
MHRADEGAHVDAQAVAQVQRVPREARQADEDLDAP